MNSSKSCRFLWPEVNGNYGQLPIIIFTGVSMFISIPGNIITGITILKNFKLRSEPAYLLICSVCVADTIVGTATQPFLIAITILGTRHSCFLDKAYFVIGWLSSCASTLGIMTITIDRYLYIVHPMTYTILMTQQRALMMIFIVWFSAFLFGTLPLIYYNSALLHITVLSVMILMSSFMMYTYSKVFFKLKGLPMPNLSVNGKKTKVRTQASRTILLVVLTFYGCWYPWVIVSLLVALSKVNRLSSLDVTSSSVIIKLHWIFLTLGYSNSALNVFVYSRKNTVLRKAVEKFLGMKTRNSIIEAYSIEREETVGKDALQENKSMMADLSSLCRRFAKVNIISSRKPSKSVQEKNLQENVIVENRFVERTNSLKCNIANLSSSQINIIEAY